MSDSHRMAPGSSSPPAAATGVSAHGQDRPTRADPFQGQPLPSAEGARSALAGLQRGEQVSARSLVALARNHSGMLSSALDAILIAATHNRISLEELASAFVLAETAVPGSTRSLTFRPELAGVVVQGINWMGIPSIGAPLESVDALLRIGGRLLTQDPRVQQAAADWIRAYGHPNYRSKRDAGLAMFRKHQVLPPADEPPAEILV